MTNIYSHIFNDVFRACEPYFMHDFVNVRCNNNDGGKKYCFFTCKKIFEETIKILDKNKYNGEIILPNKIVFDRKNFFLTEDLIQSSLCLTKKKIVVDNGIIKLTNARETEIKERILLIPIDGISNFLFGNSDFSMVIILQNEINGKFNIKNISIYNPIMNDTMIFDIEEGCKYNDKKISNDKICLSNERHIIFVNDENSKFSFDLTKLSQISDSLSISTSIFSSLCELITTKKNLCVYKINKEILQFVQFICKIALLNVRQVGEHLIIEKTK